MRSAVLAFALALILPGCIGGGDKPGPAALDAASTNATTNASRAQMPDGRSGSFAAFNETNKTENGTAGADHRHDYWEGKERATLTQLNVGLALAGMGKGATGLIRLPPKALVWEGTGAIEVTLSNPQRRACSNVYSVSSDGSSQRICSDYQTGTRAPDATGAKVHVWYQDGLAKDFADAGEVAWGKPVVIALKDPRQTDMPHATGTLWRFHVRSADAQDDTLTFDAKVDIVRAKGDVPLWPGHPDLYADAHQRVVLQKHMTTKEQGFSSLATGSFEPYAYATPDKLVSYGTRTLFVFVNNTKISAESQEPQGWFLELYNATGRVRSTGDQAAAPLAWVVKVSDAGMDSPYAAQSRWGFALRATYAFCSGCVPYSVDYDITVIASDVALGDKDYNAQA